jgi:hypothetical protein
MEEIAALAEQYGDWDDFGRWTFQNDDRLLAFVVAVLEAKQVEVKAVHDRVRILERVNAWLESVHNW